MGRSICVTVGEEYKYGARYATFTNFLSSSKIEESFAKKSIKLLKPQYSELGLIGKLCIHHIKCAIDIY